MNEKLKIAKDLLKIQAVFLRPDEPFTWASGIKSPIYCDNRLTLSDHQVRLDVENGLAAIVKEHYPEAEVLMGTSTAGIAHAAITAHLLALPMGYVRSGAKDHGRKNQIEGKLLPGQKVVVIEDLISTGGSVLEVVDVLRQAGAQVLGIASIFTYGMKKSVDRLAEAKVQNISLTDLDTVAQAAAEEGYIRPEDQKRLLAYREKCRYKKLATLFYEPSTRTRLSFESAMYELGGQVLGFHEAQSSSATKGESVADTARTVSCFADIIAMRHPKEGAPLVASMKATVPVINAGDGGHHHPTQTLTDLLTIKREKGRLDSLVVGCCGDLKFGRTVHSLIGAMSRYKNVRFVLISPEELRVPESVRTDLLEKQGIEYMETTSLEEAMPQLDILYMTRVQRERFFNEDDYVRLKDSYILTPDKLRTAKWDLAILHPLPRVNEISIAIDDDPRACYFRQVLCGKFIRMALILKLLEVE